MATCAVVGAVRGEAVGCWVGDSSRLRTDAGEEATELAVVVAVELADGVLGLCCWCCCCCESDGLLAESALLRRRRVRKRCMAMRKPRSR